MEFFYQLASENIDPRQLAVLEADARSLVREFQAMHGREPNREEAEN